MNSIEIVPFQRDHLQDAAELVANRYRAERGFNKFLPAQFEDADAVLPLLEDYANGQAGIAAICEKRLIGFLIGLLITVRQVKTAYVPDWGQAADSEGGRKTYQTMYANLARRWVADGYSAHAVTLLAHEREVMNAWFSLGFGMVGVDAVRDVSPIEGGKTEVEIRRAGLEDIDIVLALRVALGRHLAEAPIFIPLITQRGRKFYEEWLPDSANALWLAYRDSDVVAFMELTPSSRLGVLMPVHNETTVTITGAFTKEDLRQSGMGTALLNHSLEWARSAGYKNCAAEFESANIIGYSFWHDSGFEPVCYSLVRHIDERITRVNEA
jgi:GNAT superfamily N-acetyltransferase